MSMYTIASRWAVIVSFVSSTKTSGGRSRIFSEDGEGVVSEDMSSAGCSILSERPDVDFCSLKSWWGTMFLYRYLYQAAARPRILR